MILPCKTELEGWYIRRRSVGLYLLLIFLTAWVVVFPRSETAPTGRSPGRGRSTGGMSHTALPCTTYE
ncbi:hypothetical protein DEM34_10090 [Spiribacter halobius]|uniref:Uncharacterized protein n=1 Tax=Sediminicurvatus halobius TaxID=2182432 RepID=A0A2U2N1I2_9GAMM|nr:hypothetical protein DEM34_10090 [Spiribacter halobius]